MDRVTEEHGRYKAALEKLSYFSLEFYEVREIAKEALRVPSDPAEPKSDGGSEFPKNPFETGGRNALNLQAERKRPLTTEELQALIGEPPKDSHPDEWFPRSETWHLERIAWAAEIDRLRAFVATQRAKILLLMKLMPDDEEETSANEVLPIEAHEFRSGSKVNIGNGENVNLRSAQAASDGKEQGAPREPTKQSGPPPCAMCGRPPHPDSAGHSYRPESASSSSATVRGPMENDIIERIEPEDWSVLDPFFKEKDVPMNDIPLTQLGHEIEQLFYPGAPESRKRRPLEKILFKAKLSVPSGIEGQPAREVSKEMWTVETRMNLIVLLDNKGVPLWTFRDSEAPDKICDAHNASIQRLAPPPLPDNGEAIQKEGN